MLRVPLYRTGGVRTCWRSAHRRTRRALRILPRRRRRARAKSVTKEHSESGRALSSPVERILRQVSPASRNKRSDYRLELRLECAAPAYVSEPERMFSQEPRRTFLPHLPRSPRAGGQARRCLLQRPLRRLPFSVYFASEAG